MRITYVSNTHSSQSTARMRATSSVGNPTADRTITIVTRPACGTPAAPIAAAVAVTLLTSRYKKIKHITFNIELLYSEFDLSSNGDYSEPHFWVPLRSHWLKSWSRDPPVAIGTASHWMCAVAHCIPSCLQERPLMQSIKGRRLIVNLLDQSFCAHCVVIQK